MIELLSPAKDIAVGKIAIQNGADAVYIGATDFGARKAAGNSVEDIAELVAYAHRYYCRVFVTLNTILYDHELKEAERLIKRLYAVGVDALIVQDFGILKLDLPPVCLHASTQMHNYEPERIKFLDRLGFQRIVLARELSVEQIRQIRREVKAELEVFIHGALCVSLSGQCYLSQYMFGRSANRGECAQPCRMKWSVKDSAGKIMVRDRYVLSLKDLNASAYIKDLMDAGVDSFKIEGRLKEKDYVANVTRYYDQMLTAYTGRENRVGSGVITCNFEPDPEKSFNRGYSAYFLETRKQGLVNMDTPKSLGKYVGEIKRVKDNRLEFKNLQEEIHNGDGLCYLKNGELKGIKVNVAEGNKLVANGRIDAVAGIKVYRNYDRLFHLRMEKDPSVRKIRIRIRAEACKGQLKLYACDEDGTEVCYKTEDKFDLAVNARQKESIIQQLSKCGDSEFVCEQAEYQGELLFIPISVINDCRRMLLGLLTQAREERRPKLSDSVIQRKISYKKVIDWHENVVNEAAVAFYRDCGAEQIEAGFERNENAKGKDVMHTRYCLLYELGRCRKKTVNEDLQFPLFLYSDKHCFQLDFDCRSCFMRVISKEEAE